MNELPRQVFAEDGRPDWQKWIDERLDRAAETEKERARSLEGEGARETRDKIAMDVLRIELGKKTCDPAFVVPANLAMYCYRIADAMMIERAK